MPDPEERIDRLHAAADRAKKKMSEQKMTKARVALATLARQREGAVRVWWCKRDGVAVKRKGDGTTCPICGCGEMAYGCSWATLHPEREEDSRGT